MAPTAIGDIGAWLQNRLTVALAASFMKAIKLKPAIRSRRNLGNAGFAFLHERAVQQSAGIAC
jgi:hypothetical protein